MLRNYAQEEKMKEMGIENPQQFMRYQMLEKYNVNNSSNIVLNFISGVFVGIVITWLFVFVYVL